MSHYYSRENDNLKSNEKSILVKIKEKNFEFITDHGVFSKAGLDFGSRLLIETILERKAKNVLDIGSGYGPLGIIYKAFNQESTVTLTDVNDRAIKLTDKNAKKNHVEVISFFSDGLSNVKDNYDLIITNPPIRAGKEVIYQIFTDAKDHLTEDGSFIFVINQKQGAPSAIKKCESIYSEVKVINKKSGYYIIKCIK